MEHWSWTEMVTWKTDKFCTIYSRIPDLKPLPDMFQSVRKLEPGSFKSPIPVGRRSREEKSVEVRISVQNQWPGVVIFILQIAQEIICDHVLTWKLLKKDSSQLLSNKCHVVFQSSYFRIL